MVTTTMQLLMRAQEPEHGRRRNPAIHWLPRE
jgi:hypothetical protein